MTDYPVRLLTKMLDIYSPSGKEKEISQFLYEEMRRHGFKVRQDNVGNVIGEAGRGSPVILLCGHMDTVTGFIPVRIESNKIYGRGAVDAKASLAALIIAASAFIEEKTAKIVVASVVDEEGASKGVKNLLKEKVAVDYAIFGEPSGVDKITIGYKGDLRIEITCKTIGGHSAAHWLYESAVEKAIEIWNEIRKISSSATKMGGNSGHFYTLDSCLTGIRGGKGNSTVPSKCQIILDFRIPPNLSVAQVINEVHKVIEEYQKTNPKVSVKVKVIDFVEPFEADAKSPVVKALSRSIREVTRRTPMLLRKTGTGDMNIFGRETHVPVVTYGPGDPALSHTANEYIVVQEYLDSIEIYKRTINKLIESHESA
ncbi:MAG: M20/M25/M40 family metallo-hydrolase [Candidatus Bathyarchaeota archaeon]|nr:M20/M25/M40 family metallo-hydrolase [Candidatus Bathyarchaeota archaeon]